MCIGITYAFPYVRFLCSYCYRYCYCYFYRYCCCLALFRASGIESCVKRSIENMRQLLRLPINSFVYTIGAVFTLQLHTHPLGFVSPFFYRYFFCFDNYAMKRTIGKEGWKRERWEKGKAREREREREKESLFDKYVFFIIRSC